MVSARTPWLCLAVVLGWLCLVVEAHAAVRIAETPAGWIEEPADQAASRADAWAEATESQVYELYSTRAEDGFIETLAVLALEGAMPRPGPGVEPAAVMADAVGPLFETAPESLDLRERADGTVVATGQWDEDGLTYEVGVVSAGPARGVIILAVRSSERSLYGRVFDDALSGLVGTSPPLAPFDVRGFRLAIALGWTVVLVVAWFVVANTDLARDGAAAVGKGVAVIAVLLAVIAGVLVVVGLAAVEPQLALARVTRLGLGTEVAGLGLVGALIPWFVGALRDSTVRRVESAPTGGAFSGTAQTLSRNLVPGTNPAALTDPGHGSGSDDEPSTSEKRAPKPTLVGAPSLAASGEPDFDEIWTDAQRASSASASESTQAQSTVDESTTQDRDASSPSDEQQGSSPELDERAPSSPAPDVPNAETSEQAVTDEPAGPRNQPRTKTAILQFPPPGADEA